MEQDENEEIDLSVNGPGSPISLKQVIKHVISGKTHLHVLLDKDSQGIYADDADVVIMNSDLFREHALEFQSMHFNQKQLPLYLVRHLMFFFYYEHKDKVYPHDKFILEDLAKFLKEDEEGKRIYQEMLNKITYIKSNKEWQQIVGMIIILCGAMNLMRKEGKMARIYIENPETYLHPQRERLFMSFLHEIYKEYFGIDLQ